MFIKKLNLLFLILFNTGFLYPVQNDIFVQANSGILLDLENELHTKNLYILVKNESLFGVINKADNKVLAKDLKVGQKIHSILGNLEVKNIYNVNLKDTLLPLINNEKTFFYVDYKRNTNSYKQLYLENFFTEGHLKSISRNFIIGFLLNLSIEAKNKIFKNNDLKTDNIIKKSLISGVDFIILGEIGSFLLDALVDFLIDAEQKPYGYKFVYPNLGFLLKDENDPAIINSGFIFLKINFMDKTEIGNLIQKEILLDANGNEIKDKFGKMACLQVLK